MKRACILVLTTIIVSSLLLFVGYFFDIKLLMFSYYEETATGWEAGWSMLAFVLAVFCSWLMDKIYFKEKES